MKREEEKKRIVRVEGWKEGVGEEIKKSEKSKELVDLLIRI